MTRYPMTAAVSRALNDAYAVFAAAPRPTSLAGEPYDLQTVDAPTLVGMPLRALTARQLNAYAFRAVTTVGSAVDLPYFWPRLMDVSMDRDFAADAPILCGSAATRPLTTTHCCSTGTRMPSSKVD